MNRIPLFERLQIESQSHCNRSCWFCPRTYDQSGKYIDGHSRSVIHQMSTEKILDLLDQAYAMGFRGLAGFYFQSEPLLDSRNVTLAWEARKRGLKPYLHTNGDVLKRDAALCEEVKRVYEFIAIGLYDYESNEELEEARGYWRARLAGAVLKFSSIGPLGSCGVRSTGVPRALVPTDPRMAVPDLTYPNGPCHRPLIRMVIQHDGEMANCCDDLHGAFQLGNVYQSSLESLWFSERHVGIVEDLVAGRRDKYPLCRNCPQLPTGPRPDGGRIDMTPRRYAGEVAPVDC